MSKQRRQEPHQFTLYADASHICVHCDGGEFAVCHEESIRPAPAPAATSPEGEREHSPLPWSVVYDKTETRITPSYGQFRLATLESDNHAIDGEFIVRAVNSHAALVEALREVRQFVDCNCFQHCNDTCTRGRIDAALKEAGVQP